MNFSVSGLRGAVRCVGSLSRDSPGRLVSEDRREFGGVVHSISSGMRGSSKLRIIVLTKPSTSKGAAATRGLTRRFAEHNVGACHISLSSFCLSEASVPNCDRNGPSCRAIFTLSLPLVSGYVGDLLHNRAAIVPVFSFISNGHGSRDCRVALNGDSTVIIRKLRTLGPVVASGLPRREVLGVCVDISSHVCSRGGGVVLGGHGVHFVEQVIHSCGFENDSIRGACRL